MVAIAGYHAQTMFHPLHVHARLWSRVSAVCLTLVASGTIHARCQDPARVSTLVAVEAADGCNAAMREVVTSPAYVDPLVALLADRFPVLGSPPTPRSLRIRCFSSRDAYVDAGGGSGSVTIGSQPPTLLAFVPGSTIDARQRVELCEGLVRLAIRQNDAFTKNPPSPWIEFGIACYLASMSTLDREGVDAPGFRFFDEHRPKIGVVTEVGVQAFDGVEALKPAFPSPREVHGPHAARRDLAHAHVRRGRDRDTVRCLTRTCSGGCSVHAARGF